jgi:hypothetical protein
MKFAESNPSIGYNHDNLESDIKEILNKFKRKLNIPLETKVRVVNKKYIDNSLRRLRISYTSEYPVKLSNLAEEVFVSAPLIAEIFLDNNGNIVKYELFDLSSDMIAALKKNLEDKIKGDEIEFVNSDEKISVPNLVKKNKPFYIQRDDKGKQHLRRAYFS